MKTIMISIIVFLLMLLGGSYLLKDKNIPVLSMVGKDISKLVFNEMNTYPEFKSIESTETETTNGENIEWVKIETDVKAETTQKDTANESVVYCGDGLFGEVFINKLTTCSSFTCQFNHPFTQKLETRTIEGLSNGLCIYSESVPGGHIMNCNYSSEQQKDIVNYYKVFEQGADISASGSTSGGSSAVIDGQEYKGYSPSDALEDGTCKMEYNLG